MTSKINNVAPDGDDYNEDVNPIQEIELIPADKKQVLILGLEETPDAATETIQDPDYEKPPVFKHYYRKSSCWSKWLFNYPRTLMKEHAANGYNLTPDMLDDMKFHDNETEEIIQSLEKNI